jgi:hypothetical protein
MGKVGVAQVALKLKERLKISGKCQGGIYLTGVLLWPDRLVKNAAPYFAVKYWCRRVLSEKTN